MIIVIKEKMMISMIAMVYDNNKRRVGEGRNSKIKLVEITYDFARKKCDSRGMILNLF